MELIPYLYVIVGIVFFLYYFIIYRHCGYEPDFSLFWRAGGVMMVLVGLYLRQSLADDLPYIRFLIMLAGIGLIFTFIFFICAFSHLKKQGNIIAEEEAEYLIVLGAKVNGKKPSNALRERINSAYEYLTSHPETKAVLTGGMGKGEEITEAFAMKDSLLEKGISCERLLLEDKSKTTKENIAFAMDIIKNKEASVIIVTSDFHTLRGKRIALDAGLTHVATIGAKSSKIMGLHYYTRETLSWIKYGLNKIRK